MSKRDIPLVAVVLVLTAALLHYVHYLIFHDAHHVLIYLMGDIAFVPLEVLFITLLVDRMLESRARQQMLRKMNMVIGAFFSVMGARLLEMMRDLAANADEICAELAIAPDWTEAQIKAVRACAADAPVKIRPRPEHLERLRVLLDEQHSFLLGLLQNPNLLEHETFTDLLWAITHLQEELAARSDLSNLPETDMRHLSGDIHRVYQCLLAQWVDYMVHLRGDYPFLFSFQARTNPLRSNPSVTVVE